MSIIGYDFHINDLFTEKIIKKRIKYPSEVLMQYKLQMKLELRNSFSIDKQLMRFLLILALFCKLGLTINQPK